MKRLFLLLLLASCEDASVFVMRCGNACEGSGGRMFRATYGRAPGANDPMDQGGRHICECTTGAIDLEKNP